MRSQADSKPLGPVTLAGSHVRLEPLRAEHIDGLLAAARSDGIWARLPRNLQSRGAMETFIAEAVEAEEARTEFPFAVIRGPDDRIVGSTRFMDIDADSKGTEVGWTWYAEEAWATVINPAAKLLLLTHAFETWGAIRVYFKTDELNTRSRAAILKLGAKYEGTLRNHRIRQDGSYRHSPVYSVIESEWPLVKQGLTERITAFERKGTGG
jgi:RimJ/RimL family protein N-acetyltransferase